MKGVFIIKFEIRKATVQDIEEIIRLRLELFKELGEVQSEQEEALVTTATKKYLEEALSSNEFISFLALSNNNVISVSGMVLFKRPPYLDNLKGLEAYWCYVKKTDTLNREK
jgi:hypothetical protein